ncbi:mannosyltransferase [Aureobasidium pullulans]|uniref:GPI mannosyltransferase 2 n=1 Tax=Aureobasidium pullulans TaxID=5580 RepID=A0A4S9VSW5_AURPU|nr:mannosyltransferase [Aureobasidium pullulans]THZ36015.1 mannosyltransferase [Aureobasidium pullulans]THZ54956.1 mannosyltransferase [Aureobasidium pullulans]
MSNQMFADIRALACLFVFWKLLLLCIAYASPGPGYDTSTNLLLLRAQSAQSENTLLAHLAKNLVSKLVRWDALYFISVAQRGYLFEQEWAWGWGYTRLLSLISKVIPGATLSPLYAQAYAGVIMSHVAHLSSVIILYGLVHHLPIMDKKQRRKVAFVAASLHIFSTAGLFLSAPYSESLFSMLNFLGVLLHARIPWEMPLEKYGPFCLLSLLLSGACFGLATTVRSNGLFSGLIYFHHVYMLFHSRINLRTIVTIVVIGISAAMILSGMLFPQYMAYQEFCVGPSAASKLRPWCTRTLPSIYSWVQEHYWNVGFLRYWTVSNIPLFLLALPMLFVLISTGLTAPSLWFEQSGLDRKKDYDHTMVYISCLALPQILLALLALTTFHVQIVNRIATGYPIWYIVLAAVMVPPSRAFEDGKVGRSQLERITNFFSKPATQELIFRGMIMYSIIQGGLYASFMPPA